MWINSIFEESTSNELPLVVLCNKCDLEDEREIQNSEIEEFCRDEKLKLYFTSAKIGSNIDEAFDFIIKEVIKKNTEKNSKEIKSIKEETINLKDINKNANNSKCC